MDVTELRKRLQTYDQEHLLNFWNDLKEDEKKALYQELNQLDLDYVTQSFERCVSSMEAKAEKLDDHMAPLPSKFEKSVLPTFARLKNKFSDLQKVHRFMKIKIQSF